jgi:hypothetical protein
LAARELLVHAVDLHRLAPLQQDEAGAGEGEQHEVADQPLEREDVVRERLDDADLLDAAHVADLPVGLEALRVRRCGR